MRKVIKITLFILGGIILLLTAVIITTNTPWGQKILRTKAEAFLKKKLKTEVKIGHLGLGLPKYVVLNEVLLYDQQRDTLLSVNTLKVDVAMLKLLDKKLDLQHLVLKGVHSHIYRNLPDTTYNFDYIIEAFAGKDKKRQAKTELKKDDTASAFEIEVGKVDIDDIHARLDDQTGGMTLAIDLEHLALKMKKVDLEEMHFHVKQFDIAGLVTRFAQDTSFLRSQDDTTVNKPKLTLEADNVHLERINLDYNDALNKLLFTLRLGELELQLNEFDLGTAKLDVDKLAILNTTGLLHIGKSADAPAVVDTIVKKDTTQGWHVKARNIDLSGLAFKMDNDNAQKITRGIDYAHLSLTDLVLKLDELRYSSDSISGKLLHLAAKEQSGVNIMELKTNFYYNRQGAVLNNLYILTPYTLIKDHLEVHYASLASLKNNRGDILIDADLDKCLVGYRDILLFAPQLAKQQPFNKYPTAQMRLDAQIKGLVKDLQINRLYVQTINNTQVDVSGRLTGLPDANALHYNLAIARLQLSRAEIEDFVPASALENIRIPDMFNAVGTVSGTIKDYATDLAITSTDGSAILKGSLAMSPGQGNERYDMQVQTNGLNLGRILKKDTLLGEVTSNIKAKGIGFDTKTMVAEASGSIAHANAKGYDYHDITFSGDVNAGKGNIRMRTEDPNLRMHMTASTDMRKEKMALRADILLDSIDMQALKLYKTELRARGTIHADFPVLDPDYPSGIFTWTKPIINADGKRYYLDSMYLVSRPSTDSGQNIHAYFDVLTADITGKTPLTKIGDIVKERLNRRYTQAVSNTDSATAKLFNQMTGAAPKQKNEKQHTDTTTLPANYNLQLTASIVDKPMLHSIIPDLSSFDSIHIDGKLDPRTLLLNVEIPQLVYGSNTIQNAYAKVNGTDSAFTYKVTADKIGAGSMSLYYADISGNIDKDMITTNVSISDSLKKERFALAADMQNKGDIQVLTLRQGLKLDYNQWTVPADNQVVMTRGGYYIQHFEISREGQYIKANSEQPSPEAPLHVDINSFRLNNITNILSHNDTAIADGIMNGKITMQKDTNGTMQMEGDLSIAGLAYKRDTLGDLKALMNNKTEHAINANITLSGYGNDIAISGDYYTQARNGNDLDMKVELKALALRSLETLTGGQIANSSGLIRGDLKLTGSITQPKINGELKTDNLRTTITTINSPFQFPSESIVLDGDVVRFNNFDILDSPSNKATINGTVSIKELTSPDMDLRINARNWRAVHSTAKNNKTFYGDLYLTTNLTVKGTPSAPNVDGTLNILKGTNLTIVTPEKEPEIESRKGIVRFINGRDSGRQNLLIPKKKDTTVRRRLAKGSDINVNVVVDKNAQFSLVIDQANGDFLSVRGDATLNASMARNGTIALTGNYALHEGAYQFNYNFIKRKFLIRDGSNITFAGDPVNGTNMDIVAVYEATVPPYDLVQRQVPDQSALNYYKQRLPFDIELYLKGQVLKPSIRFNVALPDNKVYPLAADQIELIQGKLSQIRTDTSELNKQVFAVLILNRFVSDDPFSPGTTTSAQFAALQSVSTFIGEQLNQAASKFIKGVDFSVDLATTEDYTTGDLRQRTDLNVAASKRLLDDRLKLTVGNNFELEGPQTSDQQTSYVPSNLAADYLLSADGKYTVRGYRRAYDEGVLQGFVTETGVNFIVSLDYNRFKTIFKKRNNKVTDTAKRNQ